MQLFRLLSALEQVAPLQYAEPWDNVGLLVGDPGQTISNVLFTIDYTPAVAAEASAARCNVVIAYHPPLFKPINRLTADGSSALLFDAARRGVAIYSPHTAWDAAPGGANDFLADALMLKDVIPLRPESGAGRIGKLPGQLTGDMLLNHVKHELGVQHVLVAGSLDKLISTAACCAGAGGDLTPDALAQNADLFLTGELRHHDALLAAARGMVVACTLHSNSERGSLKWLRDRLMKLLPDLRIQLSQSDRDPFSIL